MSSMLQKLSKDLIVYSVLLTDFEKLDFKDDALAGVRANYFNANGALQRDNTDIMLKGSGLHLCYEMKQGAPLSWKISGSNQPYQTVTRSGDGSYCVLVYTDDGVVGKRIYFDNRHIWRCTEYYGREGANDLNTVISPFHSDGLFALRVEKYATDGSAKVAILYPSRSRQNVSCAALMYTNIGMLWYDACFAPEQRAEIKKHDTINGFDFCAEDFVNLSATSLDFANAVPISDKDIGAVLTSQTETCEEAFQDAKPYSAYEKIQKILFEAQKTNKNIFGEVVSHISDKVAEESSEGSSIEESSEKEKEDDCNLAPKCEKKNENESSIELQTLNGNYTYFGSVDKNRQRTGRGRTVSSDGITVYDGEYRCDKRSGFGICYYKDGSPNYVGDWQDGSRSGRGVGFRRSDGTVHVGRWKDNAPNGVGARFNKEGLFLEVCYYENGMPNGKSISFDESGNVVICVWENGELISERVITEEE